jgi:hypothetical protein
LTFNSTNGVTGAELRAAINKKQGEGSWKLTWTTALRKSDKAPLVYIRAKPIRWEWEYVGEDGRLVDDKDVFNVTVQEVPLGKLPVPKLEYVIVNANKGKHVCGRVRIRVRSVQSEWSGT